MSPVLKRPCLHCLESDQQASCEHVLQQALGCSLTLDEDVCHTCNVSRFSPVDTELMRFIRLIAYGHHPEASRGSSFLVDGVGHYLDDAGVWHTARLGRDGTPIMFPQIIYVGREENGQLRAVISLDGKHESDASGLTRIAQMQRELADSCRLRITAMVVSKPWKEGPEVQPALIRSGPGRYAARAYDEQTAEALIRMVRTGGALPIALLEHPSTRPQMGPEMHKQTSWDEGAIGRALVKTALNFICAALGPDVARHPAFHDARNFACFTNGARFREFIRPLWGTGIDDRAKFITDRVVKPGYHTVLLTSVHHFPMVFLTLYERPFAAIQLSTQPVPGALPPESIALGLFDYRTGNHRVLRANRETEEFAAAFAPIGR